MKWLYRLVEIYASGVLRLVSILAGIGSLVVLIYAIFGWSFETKNFHMMEQGLGLKIHFNSGKLPVRVKFSDNFFSPGDFYHADTTSFHLLVQKGDTMEKITTPGINADINYGVIYIKSSNWKVRSLIAFPLFLLSLLYCYGAWQLAILLENIMKGNYFFIKHYRVFLNLGIYTLLYKLIEIIFIFIYSVIDLEVLFETSQPASRLPVTLSGQVTFDYDMPWVLLGCIFLIIALAFRKGYEMTQRETS